MMGNRIGWKFWPCARTATIFSIICGTLLATAEKTWSLSGPECVVSDVDGPIEGPMRVTADCVDPLYNLAVIESDITETSPVPHQRVSGHFNGTEVEFNIYLPLKEQWAGRFFQLVYPTQGANASDSQIAFGTDSGAYTVQITGTEGYRADAATAKLSRAVAADYYGVSTEGDHIYGYIYGGSGGSYQTVGAIENTEGVWDGGVPIIQAVPVSIPNNIGIRALANLVLRGKSGSIVDAIQLGGTGDPYAELNEVESAILREATLMGIPLRAWEDFDSVADSSTLVVFSEIMNTIDPTYRVDFWGEPGYVGTEESALGDIFREALINTTATIQEVNQGKDGAPLQVTLDTIPTGSADTKLDFALYDRDGVAEIGAVRGTLNEQERTITLIEGNEQTVLDTLSPGLVLHLDNSWFLALHTYHRHQVPSRSGFYGFDQFRNDQGEHIYPQRDVEVAPIVAAGTSGGGTHTGITLAKMIVVDNLLDYDAFPWHADWYGSQVRAALGDRGFSDSYRIWYNDNADHDMYAERDDMRHVFVEFTGIYEQALRDLSAWVEDGVHPPASSSYTVEDSQVQLPETATERFGIQPVVNLTATVSGEQTVTFSAHVEVPPDAGEIVLVEWDYLGAGEYVSEPFGEPNASVDVAMTHVYETAGTYIAGVRVTSQRKGNVATPFARVMNLGRARVTVG